MSKPRDKPLTVRVTRDGVLTIEIGIDVLAFSALRSPFAWEMADDKTGRPGETWPHEMYSISSPRGFAADVKCELMAEKEDGSSVLSDAIDAAIRKAIEEGSIYWHDKPTKPRSKETP